MRVKRRRHQPRLLDGDRRVRSVSSLGLPPQLAAMLLLDARISGHSVIWIIADALATVYDTPELSPFHIAAIRDAAKGEK